MRGFIKPAFLLVLAISQGGCFWGGNPAFPTREEVIRVAASCGVPDFRPTPAGVGIAAYVSKAVTDAKRKEDCIYHNQRGRGFLLTRQVRPEPTKNARSGERAFRIWYGINALRQRLGDGR